MSNLMQNEEFAKSWQFYTEYLIEDHGIRLSQSDADSRLSQLEKLCGEDFAKAISILELMILRGETVIFEPNANIIN